MTEYLCGVIDAKGKSKTLARRAVSEAVLVRDLTKEGFLILNVEVAELASQRSGGRLKARSILRFTQILSTLLTNGLSLKDALALARPLGGKDLGPFLQGLDAQVQKGVSLHQALATGPRGFSPLYLGLIRIGEQTGDLTTILPRLVDYLKARQASREKTVNALIYPLFVFAVAIIGVVLLATLVLPALTQTISSLNPKVAQEYQNNVGLFQTMALVSTLALCFLGLVVGSLVGLAARSNDWAQRVDRVRLSIPLWGRWAVDSFCLNVSFSLELLLSSGFSLEAALAESRAVVTNAWLRASWDHVREQVVKGISLSQALASQGPFPQEFLGWVQVGEAAHDLKRSFAQLRAFYQGQIDQLSSRFTSLAEPVLIVAVGGFLMLLITTFVTPIFTMIGGIY